MPFGFLLRVGFYGRDHRGSLILLPPGEHNIHRPLNGNSHFYVKPILDDACRLKPTVVGRTRAGHPCKQP
jgi:hypothetical protein